MTANRPLGFSESFFHFMHGLGAYVVAVGARMRGPIRDEMLVSALARAQERHPLLRVHVVEERGVLRFREEGTTKIPLRIRNATGETFEAAMEAEIAEGLPSGTAPRLRALLLRGEADAFDVILAMDHAVCDGASVISVFRGLLEDFERASPAVPLAPLPSVEDLLMARRATPKWTARSPKHEAPLVPKVSPRGTRRTRLVVRDLSVDETSRLTVRCRAERTSVNGAITAAALLAMQTVARSGDARLGVLTNVALRDKADPPIGSEHVGNFVSFVQTYHQVSSSTPLWTLARECRDTITARVAAGEPQGRLAGGQLRWWQRGFLRHVAPHIRHGLGNALAISNSGRLDLAAKHGAFTLDGVYAASAQHFIGSSIALFVWSVAHAVQIVVACVEPVVPKATAERVAEETLRALRG
jgi:hypothetical protein